MTRPQGAPIETYLVSGRRTNRSQPLSMALHHVNGEGRDNRLENLALLCPNCHAQTPNFSGRNRKVGRLEVVRAA
ncbi:MAG TPA: HNH endonuclease [Thermoleophilaceae bacterium]|nr:HNH endonuclease [Thermoleophilaceae bacterium]